jgi:predicted transcriptional regulator
MPTEEKIVIRSLNRPEKESVDSLVAWFCKVFDLSEKEHSIEPTLLKAVINGSASGAGVTSKELNRRLDVPRTTVIYHLNRFISSGLILRRGRKYFLRSRDLESTIEELQADMLREFDRMIEFAERFDKIIMSDVYGRGEKRIKRAERRKR